MALMGATFGIHKSNETKLREEQVQKRSPGYSSKPLLSPALVISNFRPLSRPADLFSLVDSAHIVTICFLGLSLSWILLHADVVSKTKRLPHNFSNLPLKSLRKHDIVDY